MRPLLVPLHLLVCLLGYFAPIAAVEVPEGIYDVAAHGADPSGVADSTAAIQAAIDHCRDNRLVAWFRPGSYLVSDRLVVDQIDNEDGNPGVLIGSQADPAKRAVLVLKPNAAGFGDPDKRRAVVHFINKGTADAETGNTDLYNAAFVGLDIRIGAGNDGAVGLRLQGAEGCAIQDVSVDLREGGHTGIWGVPASGGGTHTVRVRGGRIGIDTRNVDGLRGGGTQPGPVISGATLEGQSGWAVFATARGAICLVGCRILRDQPGPALALRNHWSGQPYDGAAVLSDSIIEFAVADARNAVFEMIESEGIRGRSFVLENVYLRNAARVHDAALAGNPAGWMHFRRAGVRVAMQSRHWGEPDEHPWKDGAKLDAALVDAVADVAPPADLQARHLLPSPLPSWDTPGVVDARRLGAKGDGESDDHAALQAAINANRTVFLPRGVFRVSKTLRLRPDTRLVGLHWSFSSITAISTPQARFDGAPAGAPDRPIVQTVDLADAETYVGFIHLHRRVPIAQHDTATPGNYAIEWRCGGRAVANQVMVQSRMSTNMRPDIAAKARMKLDIKVDHNHPQSSFPEGRFAWPCAEATVQIRGNGGGRWYNLWMHGRQGLRETTPFLRVEGTRRPLTIYQAHMQQQDSLNHGEFVDARNVTVYGGKGEVKGSFASFERCRNLRWFGQAGLCSPDPDRNPPYMFRFVDCDDVLIAAIGDTINDAKSNKRRWVGGPFDRWMHAYLMDFSAILDQRGGEKIVVPNGARPIVYVRGNPSVEIQP